MYHTTGFSKEQILDLCARVHSATADLDKAPWPPILGLYRAVVVTLTYLRRNRVQAELAETYDVSQSTISRAISGLTPVLNSALAIFVPTADELDPRTQYIVDGTLLPCWSWAGHRELYSGKHKTTGVSVQVACRLDGSLAWISDPINGSRHDTHALRESEVLITMDPSLWIGDKGYIGNDMLTPIRKPAHRELLEWEKEFNTQINKVRYVIEQTIANFKTWRALHTDYRRPLNPFEKLSAPSSPCTSTRSTVNNPPCPSTPPRWAGREARHPPTTREWGGGLVVVRGRESRPHGEAAQRIQVAEEL